MKRLAMAFFGLSFSFTMHGANATSLWHVYQQSLKSDPTYQQAYADEMKTAEQVPQALSALLPTLGFTTSAGWAKTTTDSSNYATGASHSGSSLHTTQRQRTTDVGLNLTQSIFNFSNWAQLASAKDTVKAANATYNASAQDLMQRVAQAYFNVLEAKDVLRSTTAEKTALYQEYIKAKQSFRVGVVTITDVYNAKAAYDESTAQYVIDKNDLANKEEDLRSITGVYYIQLDPLKESIPLVIPTPSNMTSWVNTASDHNWTLVAANYTATAAHKTVMEARGGHLPTVDLTAGYDNKLTRTYQGRGLTRSKGPSVGVELSLPIFSGGEVTSQVREAIAAYESAQSVREKAYRDVVNQTRKAYLGVQSGIGTVNANKQVIVSDQSSLEGTKEGYKVGTRTMVDVLNAQKALYESQKNYAQARYGYILSIINLKQAAGTLSEKDLASINQWLIPYNVKYNMTVKPPVVKKPAAKKLIKKKHKK